MIWIDGAPIIGVSSDEEVSDFFQKYVTCKLPDKSDPLFNIVDSNQRYYCNNYCTRTYSGKNAKNVKYCRFKFPREVTKIFILNPVAKSIAARKTPKKMRLYELTRTSQEVSINDYNPACLYVAQCNLDLQFIAEKSSTVCEYVCKYQTKCETSNLNVQFSKSANSTTSRLWSLGLSGLQSREVGILEAVDTLLGHPLVQTDPLTFVKWVDTRYKKNRRLKKVGERSNQESIFMKDNVDDRYPNRPEDMENVSLIEFVEKYDDASKAEVEKRNDLIELHNGMGYLKIRSNLALVSHHIPNKIDKPEEYFQTFLLLFKKWRERKDVLGSFKTYEESFNDECNSNERMKKYEELVGSRYEAKKLMNEEISEEEKVLEEDIAPEHIHFSSEVHETIALQFAEGLKEDSSPYIDYIEKFNDDQFRVFIKILSCLHGQMPDFAIPPALQSKIQKELPSNALHIFVSGYGGTGKSFLIKGLTSYIQQVFNSPVALMAPTGIAARQHQWHDGSPLVASTCPTWHRPSVCSTIG